MALYHDFETVDALNAQYNFLLSIPNAMEYVAEYQRQSAALESVRGLRPRQFYGPTLTEFVDVFPAHQPNSPIMVFIHGGYWFRFASKDTWFAMQPLLNAGFAVVHVNYTLCPAVGLDEIVRQVRASLAWTAQHAEEINGDAESIAVSGHSAGGQLTLMAALTPWQRDYGLPDDLVKWAIPISPLVDLTPLRHTYLQPWLQLDMAVVQRQSPLFHIRSSSTRVLTTVGAGETPEMLRQASTFHQAWQAAGNLGEYLEVEETHHFDVVLQTGQARSPLMQAVRGLLKA